MINTKYLNKFDLSLIFITVCVSIYVSAVFCLPFRTSWTTFTLVTICSTFGLSFAYQKLKNFTIQLQSYKPISFWYFFFINIVVFSFYLYIIYPGCLYFDTIYQWREIQCSFFFDWHPAVHTLLLALACKIYNDFTFVTACQMIIFIIINSSLFHELSKRKFPKKLLLISFFIMILSPTTITYETCILKDQIFSVSILALTEILILTYLSNGNWIKSNYKITVMGITLGLATLFRHNGILFTLPFFIVFAYLFYSKYMIRVFFITIATIFVIKGPIYSYFDVKPHTQVKEELCGIPMTILSEIFVKNPSILDKETTNLLLSMIDRDTWLNQYISSSWNSIKCSKYNDWFILNSKINDSPNYPIFSNTFNLCISQFGTGKLLKKIFKASVNDPENAINAILNVTQSVWSPYIPNKEEIRFIPINSFNLSKNLVSNTKRIVESKNAFKKMFPNNSLFNKQAISSKIHAIFQIFIIEYCLALKFFFAIGLYILLLILSMFISFHRLRWKAFWLISPILSYNFGTMLIISGTGDFRFFLSNTLITIPYMIMLFSPIHKKIKTV